MEDDPFSQVLLETLLSSFGSTVKIAKSAAESIACLSENEHYDVMLLDVQLPDGDGLDVLQRSKQLRPNLPVIIQTASIGREEPETYTQLGADAVVSKPIDITNLSTEIERLVRK